MTRHPRILRSRLGLVAVAASIAMAMAGCAAGEGSAIAPTPSASAKVDGFSTDSLNIDYATYNPLSLIVKDKGYLEKALGSKVSVNWFQSAGSNKANEALKAGAIDVGSTAGAAALLARANGSPIKTIDIFSQPDWSAIVVSASSPITAVSQLKGKTIAATKGTDPYFFLLQSLKKAGLTASDVTIENLQHSDGKTALETGAVDAWAGLDPLLSTSVTTAGSKIIYDNIAFNSYGFLNATESFVTAHPDVAQVVVNAYEKARAYAIANPDEAASILAKVAGIDTAIAKTTLTKRTNLAVDPVPGKDQAAVLKIVGPIFVQNGDVASESAVDGAISSLFDTTFAKKADASAIE